MQPSQTGVTLPALKVKTPEPTAAAGPSSVDKPTFTLDELLSVFDAKLYCASPTIRGSPSPAGPARRATAPGAVAPLSTAPFGRCPLGSLPGTPEPAAAATAGGDAPPAPADAPLSTFEAACVARAGSPDVWRSYSPASAWRSRAFDDAWECDSSDGGACRSSASSPDRLARSGPAAPWLAWSAVGVGGERQGGSSIDLGTIGRGAAVRRPLAQSEPGLSSLSVGSGTAAPDEWDGDADLEAAGGGGPGTLAFRQQLTVSLPGGGNSSGGGGGGGGGAAASRHYADADDDAMCVVEVAMAAAVEATTRPPRGGRGGKHRQKAKLNQSLLQLAGCSDAGAAQAYVDACLAVYKKQHAGDPAALELLTRHLAYLIGGVVRFRLEGAIPWGQLPVPVPSELADKSRTPTYKSWLCRLGVVTPEVFSEGGCETPGSACGASSAAGAAAAAGIGPGPLA